VLQQIQWQLLFSYGLFAHTHWWWFWHFASCDFAKLSSYCLKDVYQFLFPILWVSLCTCNSTWYGHHRLLKFWWSFCISTFGRCSNNLLETLTLHMHSLWYICVCAIELRTRMDMYWMMCSSIIHTHIFLGLCCVRCKHPSPFFTWLWWVFITDDSFWSRGDDASQHTIITCQLQRWLPSSLWIQFIP
jgi:hypothetical protein